MPPTLRVPSCARPRVEPTCQQAGRARRWQLGVAAACAMLARWGRHLQQRHRSAAARAVQHCSVRGGRSCGSRLQRQVVRPLAKESAREVQGGCRRGRCRAPSPDRARRLHRCDGAARPRADARRTHGRGRGHTLPVDQRARRLCNRAAPSRRARRHAKQAAATSQPWAVHTTLEARSRAALLVAAAAVAAMTSPVQQLAVLVHEGGLQT